jgi:predicted membrane protein
MAVMTAFLLVVVLVTFMILKTGILDTPAETISIWLNNAMNIVVENLNYIIAAILVVIATVILFIRRRKRIEKMEVQQEDKEQSRIDQLQVEQPLDANKSRWMIL